jgi:hypothetical protein
MSKPLFLPLAIGALLAIASADSAAQKLYRWVDQDGKVQYGDAVPPEAIDQQRETLNRRGMTVDRVDRAMTAEERAAHEQQLAAEALAAQARDEQQKLDAVLLGSYQTEADLTRSYRERFELVEQSLESARVGIRSQEKSLVDLLNHAADLERSGKAPGARINDSIATARKQVMQQRAFLDRREADRIALQREFDETLARYRELTVARSGS